MRKEIVHAMHTAENEIRDALSDLTFTISDDADLASRQIYFLAVWQSVMETAVAVKVLFTQESYPPLYAAAVTLLRPMLEKVTRGAYMAWCATPDEVRKITDKPEDNGFWPIRLKRMLEAVGEKGLDGKWLVGINEKIGHALSSAVHGGMRHVQRFHGPGYFGQSVSEEEIEEVALLAAVLGALAARYYFASLGSAKREKVADGCVVRLLELAYAM